MALVATSHTLTVVSPDSSDSLPPTSGKVASITGSPTMTVLLACDMMETASGTAPIGAKRRRRSHGQHQRPRRTHNGV